MFGREFDSPQLHKIEPAFGGFFYARSFVFFVFVGMEFINFSFCFDFFLLFS
jgi:hypothetical protein